MLAAWGDGVARPAVARGDGRHNQADTAGNSPWVACLEPCRTATWAISCAMTPASSASLSAFRIKARVDEEESAGSAKASTLGNGTLMVKGTWRPSCARGSVPAG